MEIAFDCSISDVICYMAARTLIGSRLLTIREKAATPKMPNIIIMIMSSIKVKPLEYFDIFN